ncbi:MAG: hypothetical protein WBA51_11275 [Erythrobacter sp.]
MRLMPVTRLSLYIGFGCLSFPAQASSCHFNAVTLSPDGTQALVWSDPQPASNQSRRWSAKREFLLVRRSGQIRRVTSTQPISNLQWDGAGSILTFANSGAISKVGLEGQFAAFGRVSLKANLTYNFFLSSYLDSSKLKVQLAALSEQSDILKREHSKRPVILSGDQTFALLDANERVRSDTSGLRTVTLPGYAYSVFEPAILVTQSGPKIVGYGFAVGRSQAFSTPLVDLRTGETEGYFSPIELQVRRRGRELALQPLEGRTFVDASFNGDTVALLERGLESGMELRFHDEIERSLVQICKTHRPQGDQNLTGSAKVVELERDAETVAGILLFERAENTIVIRFPGGPLGHPTKLTQSELTQRLERRGKTQAFATYPGSVGLGQRNVAALTEFSASAFHGFLQSMARWIEESEYQRVEIVGESFGALPAYALAKRIGKKLGRVDLVAPYSLLPNKEILLGLSNPKAAGAQMTYEQAIFGDLKNRSRVRKFFENTFETQCVRSEVYVFVGDDDHIIDPAAFPECLRSYADVKTYVGEGHSSLQYNQNFLDDIAGESR